MYKKEITYSVEIKGREKIHLLFYCDGGKFGTREIIDEYELTVLELLEMLQDYDSGTK